MKTATAAALTAAALLLTGCATGQSTSTSQAPSEASEGAATPPADKKASDEAMAEAGGSYITYDQFSEDRSSFAASDIVLFFHASWCPKCQETESNLNAEAIPDGLTVVKVDYDTANDLRQEYGVTLQHTFVQIDADGNQLAKWNGSVDADDIASQTT